MRRKVFSVIAIAVWVLAGPIAMALGGCPMMALMCETPCGISACTFAPPIRVVAPHAVGIIAPPSLPPVTSPVLAVLEPPPKSAPLAA